MIKPRLTILIPTYNRGNLIEQTVSNCFNQSYRDFKIIIYDDASNDNTSAMVRKIINERGKDLIQYYKGDRNRGIGYARNMLLKFLDTEFGMWLDSDDLMTKDRIEKCISYMDKNPDKEIVYSNIQWFTEDKEIRLKDHIKINIEKYTKDNWRSLTYNTACATGFFRNSLKNFKFEESLRLGGEDVLWIWQLLQKDVKIGHIDESLYLYRSHRERIGRLKRDPSLQLIKEREEAILSRKINEIKNAKG